MSGKTHYDFTGSVPTMPGVVATYVDSRRPFNGTDPWGRPFCHCAYVPGPHAHLANPRNVWIPETPRARRDWPWWLAGGLLASIGAALLAFLPLLSIGGERISVHTAHSACSSTAGQIVQAFSQSAVSDCNAAGFAWYVLTSIIVAGLVCAAGGIALAVRHA